jgi:hypothetical protein
MCPENSERILSVSDGQSMRHTSWTKRRDVSEGKPARLLASARQNATGGYRRSQSRPVRQRRSMGKGPFPHRSNLARSGSIQSLDVLLDELLVDKSTLVACPAQRHVEQSLGFHAELAPDHLNEVFAVDTLVSFFEVKDLLVGPSEEQLVQEILVRSNALASSVQEVHIAAERTEGFQHEDVLEPRGQWMLEERSERKGTTYQDDSSFSSVFWSDLPTCCSYVRLSTSTWNASSGASVSIKVFSSVPKPYAVSKNH